jgi:nitrogen fixation NifU-like protein
LSIAQLGYNSYRANRMTVKKIDFWRDHSLHYLEMAFRHDRRGRLQNPDGYGKRIGECGDTVEMFLCIKKGRIQSVSFDTNGCINTNACANTVSHLAEGKTIGEAWEITPEEVIEFLETLPEENYHCAELSIGAFSMALANCQELQRNS